MQEDFCGTETIFLSKQVSCVVLYKRGTFVCWLNVLYFSDQPQTNVFHPLRLFSLYILIQNYCFLFLLAGVQKFIFFWILIFLAAPPAHTTPSHPPPLNRSVFHTSVFCCLIFATTLKLLLFYIGVIVYHYDIVKILNIYTMLS